MLELKLDCRRFRGDKPCRFACPCAGCAHYEPMGTRILIVKLDAIGDVARTTTILRPLRRAYQPCHVTWLADTAALDLLRDHPLVERALPYATASLERLRVERFDLLLSLDKTPRAASVAMTVNALRKLGFGLSEFGTAYPLDPAAEYAVQLGLDDELKFRRNQRTYQRTYQDVIFEVCGLPYQREEYEVPVSAEARQAALAKVQGLGIAATDAIVGVNLGGGAMFAHKMWDADATVAFLRLLRDRVSCKVLLFGAKKEAEKMDAVLAARLPDVYSAGLGNTLGEYQAMIGLCRVLVGGDSLGMHLAMAERAPQVVLFGPTCPQEIELYGRGEKIVSPVACAPCYSAECDRSPSCMEAIRPEAVVAAVERCLAAGEDR